MDAVMARCAGLDVHKRSVTACRITPQGKGGWLKEIRTFGTMTTELLELGDWLREGEVTHVAMESTGVYWKPIYNVLEAEFEILLANAKHIKFVPGRKTDVKDAQWIAELLQHGLLKASYVPAPPQRALRDLVRYRVQLVQDRVREVNRIHKVLEDANIKLGTVASDIMGASGRDILQAIIAGCEEPTSLAELARGKLRGKTQALAKALDGRLQDSHRLLLRLHLQHIDELTAKVQTITAEVGRLLAHLEQTDPQNRLDTIPGVGPDVAQMILAELGSDMSRFPTAGHATSWAGLAPGKNESAGYNQSARIGPGKPLLKVALVQAAHAAAATKGTYLAARYRRLSARRGRKRAAIAVARTILVIAYHILREGTTYRELGADYYDQRNAQRTQRQLIKRLEQLGLEVSVKPTLT